MKQNYVYVQWLGIREEKVKGVPMPTEVRPVIQFGNDGRVHKKRTRTLLYKKYLYPDCLVPSSYSDYVGQQ